jgi:hypothetical protein
MIWVTQCGIITCASVHNDFVEGLHCLHCRRIGSGMILFRHGRYEERTLISGSKKRSNYVLKHLQRLFNTDGDVRSRTHQQLRSAVKICAMGAHSAFLSITSKNMLVWRKERVRNRNDRVRKKEMGFKARKIGDDTRKIERCLLLILERPQVLLSTAVL